MLQSNKYKKNIAINDIWYSRQNKTFETMKMTQTAPGCSNLLHLLDCFLFPMPIDEPWKLPLWHKIETQAQKVWKDSKAKTCRLLIKIEILVSQFPVFESTFASHATNSIDNTFSWQIINKGLSPSLSILKVVHQIYQCCAIFWRIQLIKKTQQQLKKPNGKSHLHHCTWSLIINSLHYLQYLHLKTVQNSTTYLK